MKVKDLMASNSEFRFWFEEGIKLNEEPKPFYVLTTLLGFPELFKKIQDFFILVSSTRYLAFFSRRMF